MSKLIELVKKVKELYPVSLKDIHVAVSDIFKEHPDSADQLIIEKTIDLLRIRGGKGLAKLNVRELSDGLLVVYQSEKGAAMVSVGCLTDFVAKTPIMIEFLAILAKIVLEQKPQSVDELCSMQFNDTSTVQLHLNDVCAMTQENVKVKDFRFFTERAGTRIGVYVYGSQEISSRAMEVRDAASADCADLLRKCTFGLRGAMVEVSGCDPEVARNVCMHMVGNDLEPQAISPDLLSDDLREREINVIKGLSSDLPPDKADLVIKRRLEARLGELSLLTQTYIKSDSGETIAQYVGSAKILDFCSMRIK